MEIIRPVAPFFGGLLGYVDNDRPAKSSRLELAPMIEVQVATLVAHITETRSEDHD